MRAFDLHKQLTPQLSGRAEAQGDSTSPGSLASNAGPARSAAAIRSAAFTSLTLEANARIQSHQCYLAAAQLNLGGFLTAQKQHDQAEPLLLAAYQSMKTHPQADSPSLKRRRAETVKRLVQLYDARGKKEDAAKWRKELDTTKVVPKP